MIHRRESWRHPVVRPFLLCPVVVSVVSVVLAVLGPAATAGEALARAGTRSNDDRVDFVVAVTVDGLRPAAIRRLGVKGAPAFHRLIDRGATTLNARTSRERTITLPNHVGMVTGRRVTTDSGHGVTFNADDGTTAHRTAGDYVASMFDVVHDHGGSTAVYAAKDKFAFLDRSWDADHGGHDDVAADQGRDKIDRYFLDDEHTNVTRLIRRLRNTPDELSLLHLAYPDRAGHDHGFGSAEYLHAVRRADAQVERILDAVQSLRRLRQHVNVVLTADHGGDTTDHSDPTRRANYTVPFMVWGVGVAKGEGLYALNARDRRRPGVRRTTYAGVQPVRNSELANLALYLLDLPAVPGSLSNRRQDLTVS